MAILALAAIAVLLLAAPALADQRKKGPVKVFILAGQSNMEGQGKIAADPKSNCGKGSLQYLVRDPANCSCHRAGVLPCRSNSCGLAAAARGHG